MSSTQQALGFGRPHRRSAGSRRPPWRVRLQGSDTTWAIAFLVPYVAVFAAFVVYPVVFGLWMGSDPALYGLLFADPRYLTTAINTLLFVAIGVNVKMFLAFLLSGFFMSRSWWVRSLLAIYLLPWALPALVVFTSIHFMLVTAMGPARQPVARGHRRGRAAVPGLACDRDGVEHRRLYLEMDAVLDADLHRRPHGDPAGHL